MSPRVSVIIPTKNRANYVSSAVRSVLDQTFGDFELIVIDAASVDNTEEVVGNFHDKRVRYVRQETDRGVSASRNRGINLTDGEFIAFLDDDDVWMPTKLEKQVELIGKNPSVCAVSTGTCVFNDNKKIVSFGIPQTKGDIFPTILAKNVVGNCSAVLLRRDCLRRAGLFDENLNAAEDLDLWIRVAQHCQFDCVEEYLLLARTHSKEISRDHERVLKAMKTLYRKHLNELAQMPLKESRKILASWHYELGRLHSKLGDIEKARKEFAMAVSNNPFSALLLVRLLMSSLNQTLAELLTSTLNVRLPVSFRSKPMFNP
jgi:glycosyltransferase involved in cell wall biosynthesis